MKRFVRLQGGTRRRDARERGDALSPLLTPGRRVSGAHSFAHAGVQPEGSRVWRSRSRRGDRKLFASAHNRMTDMHVLRQAAARCSIVWSQAMLSSTTARPSTEPSRTSPTPPPAASGVRSAWCIAARACALMRRRCRIMCRALWIRGCQAAGLCGKARRQGLPNDEPGCDSWKCGHEMCIPVICCHHPLAPAASTVGLRGQWLGLHTFRKTREAHAR